MLRGVEHTGKSEAVGLVGEVVRGGDAERR